MTTISPEDINKLLPQTQCRLCTYNGCLPYAEAIANQGEKTHLCQPGGIEVYTKIQATIHKPKSNIAIEHIKTYDSKPHIVSINLDECIGCTKCLPACPVDAISGAPKATHHIIEHACTGCDLCIPTCPVDCITIKPSNQLPERNFLLTQYQKKAAREADKIAQKKEKLDTVINKLSNNSNDIIAQALERARKKRLQHE